MAYKTHDELYRLFEASPEKLLDVVKYIPTAKDLEPNQKRKYEQTFDSSPLKKRLRQSTQNRTISYKETLTEKILEHLSPQSKLYVSRLFEEDDKLLEKMDKEEEELDKIYTYFENQEVGTYLELWVCANIRCPGCMRKLLKYKSLSQPVVDVKCSNPSHNILYHGPKYYQIKATEQNKVMYGKKYFSKDEYYIKVGSKRFGYNAHNIKLSDSLEIKKILIGYICLEYKRPNPDTRFIILDKEKSFIVKPYITKRLKTGEIDNYYYTYTDDVYPTILFNPDISKIINLNMIERNTIINLDNHYNLYDSVQRRLFQKYLKYKMKYLQLKSKLNS
jgi:hypothetical protein